MEMPTTFRKQELVEVRSDTGMDMMPYDPMFGPAADDQRSWQTEIAGVINGVETVPLVRPDADIRNKKDRLTALCRSEAGKEGFVSGFVSTAKDFIIGEHGIKLQSTMDNKDAAQALERAWKLWQNAYNCDISTRRSLVDIQYALVNSLMTDGEFIAIEHYDPYQLQVVDPRLLDANNNQPSIRGNPVTMGVETDDYGKPLFYHFLDLRVPAEHQDGYEQEGRDRFIYPANRVIHIVNEQGGAIVRGVPYIASTAVHWGALRQYQEAVLIRARHEAQRMGFITKPDGEGALNTDLQKVKDTAPDATPLKKKKPPRRNFKNGAIIELKPGEGITDFTTTVPNSVYPDYIRTVLHSVAAGLNVGYHTVSGDMAEATFSSVRMGEQKTRATWRRFQGIVTYKFLDRVFRMWLLHNWRQVVTFDERLVMDALQNYLFVPRAFEYIQPLDQAKANSLDIQTGLKSRREVILSESRDPDKTFEELKDEEAAGFGVAEMPQEVEVVQSN